MGLYDADNAKITSGPIKDCDGRILNDYNDAKMKSEKIDQYLKERKDEKSVFLMANSLKDSCERLLETYPNHKEVKTWHKKAQSLVQKIAA